MYTKALLKFRTKEMVYRLFEIHYIHLHYLKREEQRILMV